MTKNFNQSFFMRNKMIRRVTCCYRFLNALIFVSLLMIVSILETDIIPRDLYRKLCVSNRKIGSDYFGLQREIRGLREFENVVETRPRGASERNKIYQSHNDTFLPLLPSSAKEKYGGFQKVADEPEVFVYSATFDPRIVPAEIKVIILIPTTFNVSTYICKLHTSADDTYRVAGKFQFIPEPNWNYTYRSGVVSCPLTSPEVQVKTVSLLLPSQSFVLNKVPVRYPIDRKNNLTRCYPAFHSNFSDLATLIWNIEISKLYGVDKFIFYYYDINESISRILRHYCNEGFVEVRNWYLPINSKYIHYWGQLAAMHDCFYSQISEARFILFADVDELVIPRKVNSLVLMADLLLSGSTFRNKNFGALVFRNMFFPIILPVTREVFPQKEAAKAFQIAPLLNTIHSRIHSPYDRSKLLVKPEAIEFLWIHAIEKFRPKWIPRIVDWDEALLQHYRYVPSVDMKPPWEEDTFLFKHSSKIVSAVRKRYSKARRAGVL